MEPVECSLCLSNIQEPADGMESDDGSQKSGRFEVYVTPCGHSFHWICFQKDVRLKNVCPMCRGAIPEDPKSLDKELEEQDVVQLYPEQPPQQPGCTDVLKVAGTVVRGWFRVFS